MKTKFAFFIIVFSFIVNGIQAQVDVEDSLATVDLYNSTNGKNWIDHTNWLTKKPLDSWFGVYVVKNKVCGLYLYGNNLVGTLPESMGNYDSLTDIQIYRDQISGTIPASIGKLQHLLYLILSENQLSGPIPSSLCRLQKLQLLSMGDNQLSGSLPDSLGNCSSLNAILLYNNQLTGSFPASLKKLKYVTDINVEYNQLSGELTDVFAKDCPLQNLDLNSNRFSGAIPGFLSRYSDLYQLYLANNQFSGPIPSWIGTLQHLNYLDLSFNQLTGGIPKSFSNFSLLVNITLHDNQLSETYNPVYTGRPVRGNISVENNRFTFNGLEFMAQKYKYLIDAPQADIPVHAYGAGLAVSAGGTLSNNTYQWFRLGKVQGVTITGDSVFRPAATGNYYAWVTNSLVPGLVLKTDTVRYTPPPSGVSMQIAMSPNPVQGIITVAGLDEKSDLSITIADMSGYVWIKTTSHRQPAARIDASRLQAGHYLLSVNDGKNVKAIQFVKE